MKMHKKPLISLFVLALAGSAVGLTIGGGFDAPGFEIAQEDLVTFQPNTVAKASEVNANFVRLRDAVNDSNLYLGGLVESLNVVLANQADQITAQEEEIAALRSVPLRRPSFRWVDADSIVIDGAASRPMPVALGAEVRSLATTLDIHTTIVGPGGLDGGVAVPNRIYYLYIVPLPAGEIAGIASLNPPTTAGPFGHATWTYLGSFATGDSSEVIPFVFGDGQYRSWLGAAGNDVAITGGTASTLVPRTLLIPAFATGVYGRFTLNGAVNPADTAQAGATASTGLTVIVAEGTVGTRTYVEIPILEASTLYLAISDTGTSSTFRTLGWIEDPLRFP